MDSMKINLLREPVVHRDNPAIAVAAEVGVS